MVKIQLRGDTLVRWQKFNPVISEREMVLVASDPEATDVYDLFKIGDGIHRFRDLPDRGLPAVQERGDSAYDVMSQKAVTRELVGLEDKLQKVEADIIDCMGDGHKQNTDTGTSHNSFLINDVLLKCCCNDLVLRSACDCDYADLTVKDLYVKGKLYLTSGIVETEVEQVKTKQSMIVLNEGEQGEGVTAGVSGIEIDRGTAEHFFLVYEEASHQLKGGTGKSLYAVPFVDGDFQSGEVPTWDENKGVFVPGKGYADNCMKMEIPFGDGGIPVWNEGKGLFVEKPEEAKPDYMEMLPPFREGEFPVWNEELQKFVATKIEVKGDPEEPDIPDEEPEDKDIMRKGREFEDGDGVIFDKASGRFVPGLPYDPLCMRRDRIWVVSSVPLVGMEEGDIVIIVPGAPAPPDTPEEVKRSNPYVMKSDIADNLVTDDATKVLSARQGRLLSASSGGDGLGGSGDFIEGFNSGLGK